MYSVCDGAWHMAHTLSYPRLMQDASKMKALDLMDLLYFFQGHLEKAVPARWFSFAADVAEAYSCRHFFVDGTDAAAQLSLE